ncbi:ATP-binding protein [Priestia megaterium]|uniref:ATP-binding protein n=1 Tax=Priestia megaterium TaxID=1404 RepID=UPI0022B8BF8A|nr:ATP-binding protein [Priestia megaterium]MCZ8494042.1 ATP-binding protein [Priestia megaterium]
MPGNINKLEKDAFSKIGNVVEVNGSKIIIKIDKDKNLTNLFFQGEIYRNVGIGSYLKIKKDFVYIIGKVEREFVKDKYFSNGTNNNLHSQSSYDRFVEVAISGSFSQGNFFRGIKELPFLYNEAFLLSEDEVKKIYKFSAGKTINIGAGLFDSVNVEAGISKLFASHIGVFGNTGSGKSNSLARLYYNLFNCIDIKKVTASKFIIIDFNGEYSNSNTITEHKYNVVLSTKRNNSSKLFVKKDWLDEEFWSIILQATDKTQKPFIKRVLNYVSYLEKEDFQELKGHIINTFSSIFRRILNNNSVENRMLDAWTVLKNCIQEFFEIHDVQSYNAIARNYNLHNTSLCRKNGNQKIYFGADNPVNVNKEVAELKKDIEVLMHSKSSISTLKLFELSMGLKLAQDVLDNLAQYDHIKPIIHRFQKRAKDLEKIIDFSNEENDFYQNYNVVSISLRDVNVDMKKIIPLLLTKKLYEEHKEKQHKDKGTLHLIIDEAHNILSHDSIRESEIWKDYRLEVFEEIIKEGRKFGVFLTLSSQRPSDISNTIISQLHNVLIHRLVNNNDLKAIEKSISFLDKMSFDTISILPPGGCIFTGTATDAPIAVQIPILEGNLRPQSDTINLEELWNL